jgi:hypothetical protein
VLARMLIIFMTGDMIGIAYIGKKHLKFFIAIFCTLLFSSTLSQQPIMFVLLLLAIISIVLLTLIVIVFIL